MHQLVAQAKQQCQAHTPAFPQTPYQPSTATPQLLGRVQTPYANIAATAGLHPFLAVP